MRAEVTIRQIYQAVCDRCGATQRIGVARLHEEAKSSWREASIDGWRKSHLTGKHYCPDCWRKL